MIKIKWDLPEAVVLLDTLLENWGRTSVPETKLLELSEMYKRKATASGISYDEKYRNLAGLKMHLACLQFIVSEGQAGMPNASKVFHEAYELFQHDPNTFKRLKEDFYSLYGGM